jgi:hypothetical protein
MTVRGTRSNQNGNVLNMTERRNLWKERVEKERKTPKFVKAGTMVLVDPKTIPQEIQVEGKFGKRKMFIVDTKDVGLVYVTPLQMMHINDVFNENYSEPVTVTL